MYYKENGVKHYAPYWSDVSDLFLLSRKKIPSQYNKWDFMLALNTIKSDYYPLLKGWFSDEREIQNKIIELTINWLNDEDIFIESCEKFEQLTGVQLGDDVDKDLFKEVVNQIVTNKINKLKKFVQ